MADRGRNYKRRGQRPGSGRTREIKRKREYQLLVNTAAGEGKENLELAEKFKRYCEGTEYQCYLSHADDFGQFCKIATDLVKKRPFALIVFGGDGSVRAAAERVVKARGLLGIVPCGRHNNIFNSLYGNLEPEDAVGLIKSDYQTRIDAGVANGWLFLGSLSTGLIPAMVNRMENKKLPRLSMGWTKLVNGALADTATRSCQIKVDSYIFEVEPRLLNIHLLPHLMGLPFAPAALPDDGRLILIFDDLARDDNLAHYIRDLKKNKYQYNSGIQLVRGFRASIQPVTGRNWLMDGDPVEFEGDEVNIEVLQQALRIFTYAPDK